MWISRQSHLCLSYVYLDLCYGECYYTLLVVCVCSYLCVCFVCVCSLLNAVGELTVFSLKVLYCCSKLCDTLVGVSVLLIISEIN